MGEITGKHCRPPGEHMVCGAVHNSKPSAKEIRDIVSVRRIPGRFNSLSHAA
jgi:hypothetical protein